jgi:hypothetical protein
VDGDGIPDDIDDDISIPVEIPVETTFTVYDKNTHQYVPAIGGQHDQDQGNFFNDPVRIVVPNKRDAKASRVPVAGTGNRYFKR